MRITFRTGAAAAALSALAAALAYAFGAGDPAGPGDPGPRGRPYSAAAASAPATAQRHAVDWRGGRIVTSTGEQVTVYVSTTHPADQVSEQYWADFFAALPHRDELALATIRIAPLAEVQLLCEGDAYGCYAGNELVVMGEPADNVTPEEVARHEYGHHIAAHRLNPPWRALDWGTKRWATVEDVCRRASTHTAFPGGLIWEYRLDPGEAFAEAYRVFAETRVGMAITWRLVDESFYPDPAALAAVEHDVTTPWTAPARTTVTRRFAASGPTRIVVPVAVPLDGTVDVQLSVPAGRLDALELVEPGGRKVIARGLWSSARTRALTHVACGYRRLLVRVTRKGAPGPFRLVISRP